MTQPWREGRLAGQDLDGNLYWEAASRRPAGDLTRRWIEYADGRADPARFDADRLPVQWLAWLRHTRGDAPTIE
ncbi:hypothetical protein HK405_014292, partial [Cladochytrium tenue]